MWELSLTLAACLLAGGEAYFFESGYSHHYTYKAENDLFGHENITTVLKFQVSAVNETENGYRLHSLTVDSLVQFVKGGSVMNNPNQWDLTKAFVFMVDDTGGVRLVHCHPDDHEELLVIKKAMVSVFSVHVKINHNEEEWRYMAEETDHLGRLEHSYRAQRTRDGMMLERNFSSFDDAHRFHEKTLHYDHQGTLHKAETKDRVHLKDRLPPAEKTSGLPGELPHKTTSSGDFPEIEVSATVQVTLDSKRPSPVPLATFQNLSVQTLETKPKRVVFTLRSVMANISKAFECIQRYPEKNDVNRSLCIDDLRDILENLDKEDYEKFVGSILGNGCQDNNTVCEEQRLVLIDVIARIGDVTSQELVLKHVLSKQPTEGEELRRVFAHCVALKRPIQKFVRAIEGFCFGETGEHHGSRNMTRTQRRACLAVGSLTRNLATGGRHTLANALATRLETWLDELGKGDHEISKRDTWLTDTEHEDHHISKAVLLHALGNAALTRSRRHLLDHAQPNRGHHVWRRAALDALRHYTCKESASALLDCLLKDDKHSVRQMALSVYVKHPRRREVTRDKENFILSRNYTYHAVARVKREVFEDVLLRFKVALPAFAWKKEVGSKAVGGSFGIYFNNYVDILFKTLGGYIDVNIEDKLWAELHIGVINQQWDILLIDACYRGRLKYNMNLMKDYNVSTAEDISSTFDHIITLIMEPMEKAASELAAQYQDPDTDKPKSGFDALAQAVKSLPTKTQDALQATVSFTEAAEAVGGLPLVTKIQQLAVRAQSLMENVHSEATDLFVNIKDAAVVALPFAEKEIRGAINTVLDKLGDVNKAPKQVFFLIERAKLSYQLAMQRIIEGNNILKQEMSFLSGSRSTFMNIGEELQETMEAIRQLVERLKADGARRKTETSTFDDLTQAVESRLDAALEDLYNTSGVLEKHVQDVLGSASELQAGVDMQVAYVEILKSNFQEFKEAIDMIKSRINALFGQKFHPMFPDQRRDCDRLCGCGYFTGECRYGHPGIDLRLDSDLKVYSPVAGLMVPVEGDNTSVIINPATTGFTQFEVILSNIIPDVTLNATGTFVDAGQAIGTPVGPSGCETSHIHVAMKRKTPDAASGLCYYVDPTPFLDIIQPVPQWEEECKHFTFKHIGQIVDFSNMTSGFDLVFRVLLRFSVDVGKKFLIKAVEELPDDGFLGKMREIAVDIVEGIDIKPADLKNLFKGGEENKEEKEGEGSQNSAKGFLENISSKKFSLAKILSMAQNATVKFTRDFLSKQVSKIKASIDEIIAFIKNPKPEVLGSSPTGVLRRILSSLGLSMPGDGAASDGGQPQPASLSYIAGKLNMLLAVKTSPSLCPSILKGLSASSQSTCLPDTDCLGVDCNVQFSGIPGVTENIDVSVRVLADESRVELSVAGNDYIVTGNGTQTLGGINVLQVVNLKVALATEWDKDKLQFSLHLLPCATSWCLPKIPLMSNVHFNTSKSRQKRSTNYTNHVANLDDMESKPLDEVIRILSDLGRDVSDIADQSTGILDAISSVMTTNEEQGPSMTSEFINPFDQKDNGSYPVVGENGELYVPFFRFIYKYPVGPCLFIMKFRAGGAFGVSFGVSVQAVDAQMQAEFKPWISGKLQADLSLSIVVAKAGIRLTGYVLKTGFPLSLSTNFKEQPLTLFKRLEVELIPIELKLVAYVEIFWIIKIRKTIWQWSADPIRGTIWEKKISKEDKEPPEFQYCDELSEHCVGRSKRQVTGTGSPCSVVQLSGRHPHDPAFKLEFSVNDEDSAFELWYAVGDYPGGTSVVDWTEMRGASLLVPAILPCGVPLYFLVRARNSQGLETTARCSIPTYDCTFPDGRVDAAYKCTSHPSKVTGTVVLHEDSKLNPDGLFHGVGYSPSSYGHEVVDWLPLTLSNSQPQQGASGDLRYFSPPRAGRLTSTPKKLLKTNTAIACASECLKTLTCVSFSHNEYLQDCELQEVTEGARAERRSDGHFVTYERLGKSFIAILRYEDLPLRHGTRYYINADIENVLGYHATLTSGGTMVDFTPPEPGPVGEVLKDEMTAAGCDVSILQRCVDHVASSPNHRNIVDGEGSTAVLNGNRRGQDLIHTTENYHASVNWDGFKDEECGIHGYTFAVGTTVCGSDVVSFRDPHTSIHNPDDWTHTGVVKDIHLSDGSYYVTVQAVNDVIHGGDLVTTVCHSTPFLVDTTPPLMNSVDEVLFDETFRFLVVYYNASDVISGVARMEFGLGKTKYDARIRPYLPFEMRGENNNTYLVNEEFETSDGVPAWIRLKVVNNVDLSATGTSEAPIIIDDTPPIAGHVMDGTLLGQDVCCQNGRTEICAQWVDFHDPDSSIESYFWGVGLSPGQDDVVLFHSLSSNDKQSCVHVQLQHSMTYFSTVIANNRALNQKSANTTSGGVLIDVTPPIPGTVSDGDDVNNDINFTSKTATITTTWSDFQDPESGLTPYSLSVFINQRLNKVFTDIEDETFTDHSFSLNHGDSVNAVLLATNRAGGSVTVATDGMLVDHTSPDLQYIRTVNQTRYQLRDDVLHFIWKFEDLESGVAEYRCIVYELKNGRKTKFWPELAKSHVIDLTLTSTSNGSVDLHGVKLKNGAAYSLAVTAVNRARISTAEESMGVIVDTTPPEVLEVKLSRPDEQEEVNDDNQVEHVKGEPLWVTWDPHDVESGIEESQVCIGLAGTDDCLPSHTVTLENSLAFAVSFEDDDLKGSTDSETFLYQAYVVVTNGAGVQSAITASKPFLVLQANVAGLVLDGEGEDDLDFSYDMAAVAITFSGFSSVACGIVGYEWGVGTTPFATDVLPYSDFGLVVDDHGNGFAEAHIMQFEGQTYYSTVRAITGHNCHEEYIVSSSDGFTVDTTPPSVTFHVGTRQVTSDQVVYQTRGNKLELAWSAEDASGVNETRLTLDLFDDSPNTFLVPSVLKDLIALDSSPSEGDTIVSTIVITDNAGNGKALYLPPVTFDYSPPLLLGLKCTEAVSVLSSVLTCAWRSVEEEHSELSRISFGLGSGLSVPDLMNFTLLSLHSREWTVDTEDFITSIWITEFYVIISASNSAGLQTNAVIKVTNDVTPPADFSVRVVTSPLPGYHDKEQKCQTPQDYVEVLLEDIGDDETGISRVEMAIGSSSGRADISPFRQYPLLDGFYIMGELGLQKGSTVYVTVRVTNGVGLSTIGTSDGVVISPEPRLEVFDGPGDIDMDGQAELDVMQGSWRYSDPCPILSAEWSLRELGGKVLVDFTAIPDNANEFYDDSLSLENLKVYVNYVRIKDAMGRTFTAFSDGVTVVIRTPDVATVRDGLGPGDQDFQEPTDRLSASWNPFGDAQSTLPSDHIVRYETAVGTDRRYPSTRSNIHAFEDVGMATNFTFYGLSLTEKTVMYFITVRGYSGAGSVIESSSDGIRVGFSADMEPGQIQVERYQGSVSSIRFWWADFVSDMIITHYYVGVSTSAPPWDNSTYACAELLQSDTFTFDVYTLQPLEADLFAVLDGLSLTHGSTYHVTLVAEDNMGHCSAVVSGEILVDTTPPVSGKITVEGTNTDTVSFLHSEQTVVVNLGDFPDPESGIKNVQVELFRSETCNAGSQPDTTTPLSMINAVNESRVTIRDLQLQEDAMYFLRVTVRNGAGLETTATSLPLILDPMPPIPGLVKLGTDWTAADGTFQNVTELVRGLIALKSLNSEECITRVDLLSADAKNQWKAMGKEFSEDCVGFDVSGLHVIVQHNPHLTGVDRGAAQFSKMSWREGDYIFRLSPATGPNVLFGIALNSPSLRPPFLSQNGMQQVNQSSVSCDPTDDTCDEDTGNSTAGSSMPSDSDYGIGLSFLERDGEVQALLWAQDVLQLKQMWITLDFDPGVTEAEYILRLHKTVGSDQETLEVTAIVNGEAKAAISGLVLQMEFVISVYAWNIGGYLPPVTDPFSPFRASTIISDMSLPVDERPLCSYGSPFRDLLSGIKEVWVGVSDDFNVTANVAPYQLVSSFCLPCLRGCDDICSSCGGESLASGYSVLPVMRSGLSLQGANEAYTSFESNATSSTDSAVQLKAAADELKQFQLPTYYLDVQVVDHSGLATDVKSTGFIVDTSPPVITSLYCTDPEYMADVEILYLGNNYTVGVNWDITEDVSSITDVILRVGSQPGLGDSAAEVHVDPSRREYVFDNLEPNLMEGQTYFVTLRAENEAGLVSQGWSNFTVQTMPTNMSDVSVTLPNVTVVTLAGKKVGLLENTERLELSLSLDAEDIDVEYYELAIGTAAGTDNVFPKTVVGSKNTTKVAIVHGFLKRDDVPSKDASIGDYTKKNYTSDTEPDPSANKFSMEPGRCLTQRLYGVNKGHVSAAVDLLPVCIKRPRDVMFEADNTTHQLRKNGNTFSVDGTIPPSSSSFSVAVTLSEGALLAGVLDDADLQDRYGTSASTEFSPFIVQPDPATDRTSRWLRKRLVTMPGPDIYLSPIAEAEFSEDVEVNYTVPSSVDIPDDSLVMILFWNPGTKQWEAPDELCSVVSTSFDKNTRVVSAKLCAEVFSEQADPGYTTRKKRSADDTHAATLGPRMVTVAVVRTSPVNLPPIVHNTSFTMLEDGGVHSFTIAYTDDEGDEMVFTVARQPGHGTVDVTEDGHVQYHPDPNFGGEDFIYVTGREQLDANALAMGVVPQTVNFTITVQVSHVNDPPDIFYLPENYTDITQELLLGPTAGNGVNMSVLVEGNTTTLAVLGTVVFADKDLDDISFFDQKQETSGLKFIVEDLSPGDPQLSDILLVDTSKASGKRITLSLADGYPGRGLYEARVKDTADAFSLQLTLDVRILLNPCFYGHCKPRDPDSTCLDQRRALTFDPYVCECDLGYEGQWCETDTDECVTSTCSPITDCVDLIGGYRCDYNPMKLAAIVVCCAVAALLGIFAFYKLKKKNAKVEPWNKCDDGELKECTFATLPTVRTETMTPPSETSSEFYDNPLFAYRPSQNPTAIRHTAAMFSAGGSAAESSAKGKAHTSRRSSQKKMVAFGSTFTPPEPAPRKTRSRSVTIETAPKVVKFDVPKNEVGPDKHHGTARSMPVSRRHSIVTIALEENRLPKVEN